MLNYYQLFTMDVPNLCDVIIEMNVLKQHKQYDYVLTDMQLLMSSGNVRDFIDDLFENRKSSSVRRYLLERGVVRNDLMYVYQVKHIFCSKCKYDTGNMTDCLFLAHTRKCQLCIEEFVSQVEYISQMIGKKYYHMLFYHYYLFSHCDLLKDVKNLIRNKMFIDNIVF